MIISASRRTDIPTYYSQWFFNRIKEGFVCVRNPFNCHQISKISLDPKLIDGIVFWTKNPKPMLNRLNELEQYPYYFQFTLNPYGKNIEPNVPDKKTIMIPMFKDLSKTIGKEKVIWRYDPIFLSEQFTIDYHTHCFNKMADELADFTEKCTISFIDLYTKTGRNTSGLNISTPNINQMNDLAGKFAEIAKEHGIYIDTCAESINLEKYGIQHAHCIDKERLERIGNYKLDVNKDSTQRLECGCMTSIDIGIYDTCKNGCKYCYANYNDTRVNANSIKYDVNSPILCSSINENTDIITERKIKSYKQIQPSLFDE